MAKLRMNHSRQGRGAGSNVIRMFGVVFFLLILLFLGLGRHQLSNRLDDSVLFPEQEEFPLDSAILLKHFDQVNVLHNPYFGSDSLNGNKRFAFIPDCKSLQSDSILFNEMYFIPTSWLEGIQSVFIQDFFRTDNLTGLDYGIHTVMNPFSMTSKTCKAVFLEVSLMDGGLMYTFYLNNEAGELLKMDSLTIRF